MHQLIFSANEVIDPIADIYTTSPIGKAYIMLSSENAYVFTNKDGVHPYLYHSNNDKILVDLSKTEVFKFVSDMDIDPAEAVYRVYELKHELKTPTIKTVWWEPTGEKSSFDDFLESENDENIVILRGRASFWVKEFESRFKLKNTSFCVFDSLDPFKNENDEFGGVRKPKDIYQVAYSNGTTRYGDEFTVPPLDSGEIFSLNEDGAYTDGVPELLILGNVLASLDQLTKALSIDIKKIDQKEYEKAFKEIINLTQINICELEDKDFKNLNNSRIAYFGIKESVEKCFKLDEERNVLLVVLTKDGKRWKPITYNGIAKKISTANTFLRDYFEHGKFTKELINADF